MSIPLSPKHVTAEGYSFPKFNWISANEFSYTYRKLLKLVLKCMHSLVYISQFAVINSSVNQHLRKHLHVVDGTDAPGCTERIPGSKRRHRHPRGGSFWKTPYPVLQGYDGRERYRILHNTEILTRFKEERHFPIYTHMNYWYTSAPLGLHCTKVPCSDKKK